MSKPQMRIVTNTAEFRQAIADGLTGEQIEVTLPEDVQRAIDAAREEAFLEARARAFEEAVLAERGRIIALTALTPRGFENELQAAIDAGTEPGPFAMELLQLQAARAAVKH